MRSTGFFEILLFYFFVSEVAADLLPIVGAQSNCSGNGQYDATKGLCQCNWPYSGRICQYEKAKPNCLVGYDCYNCEDYSCPKYGRGYFLKNVWACDGTSTTYDSESHKDVPVKLHNNCRNITSLCYEEYECECPSGIAFLGSVCFRDDLIHNFGFFMLIMAALTVFSTIFEFGTHYLEHRLEDHNQKAIVGIIQTFKSELTLIGIISLTLYLVSSSTTFEHGIEAIGGKEDIIEAIHFLIFFMVLGYFFTLAICFIGTKIFLARRLRKYEEVFQAAREAALKGENYEGTKRDLIIQNNLTGFFAKLHFREYNAYRIYFMRTLKNEYSEEDLMFFRFDNYLMLCVNDLIGRISGGTWLAWIYFAWNFFANVYLDNSWMPYVSRVLVTFSIAFAGAVNEGARDGILRRLEKQNEGTQSEENNDEEMMPIASTDTERHTTQSKSKVSPIILFNQSMIWFGLTYAFTSAIALTIKPYEWYWLLIFLVIMFIIYAVYVFHSLQTIAGAIYNGPLINKQYVKEVMKRHPQVDKHILIEQYRHDHNDELPIINDVVVSMSAK